MSFPVTLNGRTYTIADFEGTNYVDGFPDALEDFVTQAGDIYNSTSTSSVAIGTGSKTFTTADSDKPYQAGTPLRIADAAAPETNFLDCIVTSYSGTTLVVDVFGFAGSGTISDWTINIGGAKTVDGTLPIAQGGTGATTASAAADNLGLGTGDDVTFNSVNANLTGNVSGDLTGAVLTASQPNITSVGTITSFTSTGIDDNASSTALTLDSSGNVGIGTSSPTEKLDVDGNILASGDVTAFSDERLKADIQTLDGSKVLRMRGVSFVKDGNAGSGVIAQELQKVAPELVNDSGEYLSVAYGNLVGYLIEAVKELNIRMEELENGAS